MLKRSVLFLGFSLLLSACPDPRNQNPCITTIASGGRAQLTAGNTVQCLCGSTIKAQGGACTAAELAGVSQPMQGHIQASLVEGAIAVSTAKQQLDILSGLTGEVIQWDNTPPPSSNSSTSSSSGSSSTSSSTSNSSTPSSGATNPSSGSALNTQPGETSPVSPGVNVLRFKDGAK